MYSEKESCCFTGHRDIERWRYEELGEKVQAEIEKLYALGVRNFVVGGAVGFDMICAVTVANLKNKYNDIVLTLALPCKEHDKKWGMSDKALLETLKRRAEEIVFVSEEYEKSCMLKRNRYMVDRCHFCICNCIRNSGGSYYTKKYALKKQREIIDIK